MKNETIISNERKKESFKIFDDIAATYDTLNHLLSFGIDIFWRNKLVKKLPQKNNLQVIDLATGTGDLAFTLMKSKWISKVIGMDLSVGMLNIAKKKLDQKFNKDIDSSKIEFKIGDGTNIPENENTFDVATISFGIRNYPDFRKGLREFERVLRPGGQVMIMEFSIPQNFLVRQIYFFYFRNLLPFVGNLISGHKDAYSYLNKTVEHFPYGDQFVNEMKQAGLVNVKAYPLTFGIATIYIGNKQ